MAKYQYIGTGTVHSVVDTIKIGFPSTGISCQLVDEAWTSSQSVCMLVFEKYYMRAENRVSLSAMVYEEDAEIVVDVIGSGGGRGAIFSFSWGSEEDFALSLGGLLADHGFRKRG